MKLLKPTSKDNNKRWLYFNLLNTIECINSKIIKYRSLISPVKYTGYIFEI